MTPKEKIQALRDKYKKELPSKFYEIEELFNKYELKGFDKEGFSTFYRLVHNLVGSGATFGFMNVSEKARVLDDLLKIYIIENRLPSQTDNIKIKVTLHTLSRVCIAKNIENVPVYTTHSQEQNEQQAKKNHGIVYLLFNKDEIYFGISEKLQHFGFTVSLFYNTDEIIEASQKQLPTLVLVDYSYLVDETFCNQLNLIHEESTHNCTLFTLAPKDDFLTRVQSVKCGSDWFFTKPLDADFLIDKFDMLTNNEHEDPIKVLLLDDEIDVANFYASILEEAGIEAKSIDQPSLILEIMAEYKPDLLLTDLYMHEYNGSDIAKVLRQIDEYVALPIIFLSIENNDYIQNQAIKTGAEDFILKSIDPKTLVAKVKTKVKRYRSLKDKIEKDALTNLYNHISILNLLEKEIEISKRHKHPISFVMLDIDFFKKVNDNYGHQTGDIILKSLAYLLKHRVRESDSVGRYGGEEFALILPYTNIGDAFTIVEEIRKKFAQLTHSDGGQEFHTTFSAGVCQYLEGMSLTELVESADNALYKAKESGRNQTIRCS